MRLSTWRSTGFPKASFPSSWKETPSIEIFSTLPSYKRSPSRRKYVRACGFETTAIIPFGARTMPSRRSVLTCKPSLPGGRFAGALFNCRPSKDSKGSLRACLTSLSAAAGAEPGVAALSTALTAGFAGDLPVAFAAGFAAGFTAGCAAADLLAGLPTVLAAAGAAGLAVCGVGLVVCGVDLAAAGVAGLAACCAGLPAPPSADFTLLGVDGLTCARRPGVAAAIKIPSPRVIAERIVRSFPLRVSQPRRLEAWLRLTEPHRCRRALARMLFPCKFQQTLFPGAIRYLAP